MAGRITKADRILVTGATGKVGRHLVDELLTAGVAVRALVRDPGKAGLPEGVELVRGDLAEPDTLEPALQGMDGIFLLWPFFGSAGAPRVVEAIARHVRHVVYLSSMGVRDDLGPEQNGVWGELEHLIVQSGLEWTFLRAGGFAANALEWAAQIRGTGVLRRPYGGAVRSSIHEADIAAVAARVLTEPGHTGAKYVLTGPEQLTFADQVRIIGEAIGRPVRWEEIPADVARQQLLAEWGDPDFVDGALAYWAGLAERPEPVTRTVERLTGRPARTFREWATDHAEAFAAQPEDLRDQAMAR
ncbi:SDR family oxidoreductase [Luteimonas kalidii]|uniref:NAD(P)H-binding protein n=1 Tax=Luteimonas kalidii TaxID=3042025 RepID=A0ABT6JRJ6_9GAMM|nr:NAD(P)H-binding protein [Luteimonas kalidii]MDH5833300.1 NAD(P)H-binding protein [Luteimonas kalidii]